MQCGKLIWKKKIMRYVFQDSWENVNNYINRKLLVFLPVMMVFGEYYERVNIEVFGIKCFDVYHFEKNVFQYVWYKANVAKVD